MTTSLPKSRSDLKHLLTKRSLTELRLLMSSTKLIERIEQSFCFKDCLEAVLTKI